MPAFMYNALLFSFGLVQITGTESAFLGGGRFLRQLPNLGTKAPVQTGKPPNHNELLFTKKHGENKSQLQAGFFDDIMSGKMFTGDGDEDRNEKNSDTKKDSSGNNKNQSMEEDINWNEADFREELNKRDRDTSQSEKIVSTATATESSGKVEEEKEFDGYAMRDVIYSKWGKCYDIDFQPVTTFGFRELYLNVMPFHLGGRRFRHESELDYLCHLQAVVEILDKYEQLEYVLSQLEETTKKPRAGTSPLVAVPFRLDLTEDELNSILQ